MLYRVMVEEVVAVVMNQYCLDLCEPSPHPRKNLDICSADYVIDMKSKLSRTLTQRRLLVCVHSYYPLYVGRPFFL